VGQLKSWYREEQKAASKAKGAQSGDECQRTSDENEATFTEGIVRAVNSGTTFVAAKI
jgi:hypothetical protein